VNSRGHPRSGNAPLRDSPTTWKRVGAIGIVAIPEGGSGMMLFLAVLAVGILVRQILSTYLPSAQLAGHQYSSGRRMVVTDRSASVMTQTLPSGVS
jgi:hypothetical protein